MPRWYEVKCCSASLAVIWRKVLTSSTRLAFSNLWPIPWTMNTKCRTGTYNNNKYQSDLKRTNISTKDNKLKHFHTKLVRFQNSLTEIRSSIINLKVNNKGRWNITTYYNSTQFSFCHDYLVTHTLFWHSSQSTPALLLHPSQNEWQFSLLKS